MNLDNKKILICVVAYNRIGNFIKWCKLAKLIKFYPGYLNYGIEIRIIHNFENLTVVTHWKAVAANYPVTYIPRENVGLDIGVFQEVCKSDNGGILVPYDYLIWFTDDCLPTSLDFISDFVEPFEKNNSLGLICFEMSRQIRPHVRTTGFCLKRETLPKITFPVPKILTKKDCYDFEHGQKNLYLQIAKLGLTVKVIDKDIFCNTDSVKVKRYGFEKSQKDLYRLLYGNEEPDVKIFSTAYSRYPQIVSSILTQKYQNLKLTIWHDGEISEVQYRLHQAYENYKNLHEEKIYYVEIGEEAKGNYGHHLKQEYLKQLALSANRSEYLLITNEDNYISPYMISKAVEALEKFPEKIGAYCSGMVHNYKPDDTPVTWREKKNMVDGHVIDGYGLIPCKLERGYMDISCIVFRTDVALAVPWADYSHSSDWTYIENIMDAFGKDKFVSFPGIHLVHN